MSSKNPRKKTRKKKPRGKPVKEKEQVIPKPQALATLPKKAKWLAWGLILILAFLLYGKSIPYEFVLDDKLVLSENSFVKQGFQGIWDIVSNESFTGFFGGQQDLVAGARYRPLSLVTYAVEVQFFGLNPEVHRFINILLYGLTGIALFQMIGLLFPARIEKFWSLALVTALIFILHPLHIEAVANIKGRDEILALLFSILTLSACFHYHRTRKTVWLIGASCCFFLALMSKENSIAFLGVIPLALYFFANGNLKKIGTLLMPLFLMALLYILIRYQVIGYFLDSGKPPSRLLINNPFLDMTVSQKYATIFYTLLLDLKLLFFPHPLTSDYNPYHIPIMNWSDWRVLLSLVVYLGMGVFVLFRFRKNKVLVFCILFFLFTIFLVSNILFPVGSFMNERFLFMPSVSACLLLGWMITEVIPKQLKMGNVAYGLFGLIAFSFAAKTFIRLPDWKNPDTLTASAVKVSKNSARANSFYAYQLYRRSLNITDHSEKKATYAEALPYAEKAISIYPDYPDALTTKAGILAGYYQMDNQLKPLLDGFYQILEVQSINFIIEYLEYLNKRDAGPELLDFYYKAGYELYAVKKQDYQTALKFLEYGRQISPNDLRMLSGISAVFYYSGNYQKSLEFGLAALQQHPDHAFTNYIVGLTNEQLGNKTEAGIYLNKAYALDPSLQNR